MSAPPLAVRPSASAPPKRRVVRLLLAGACVLALAALVGCGGRGEAPLSAPAPVSAPAPAPSAETLDPAASEDARSAILVSRARHTSTLLRDGRVLVVGGMDNEFRTLSSTVIFDPALNAWTASGDMSEARSEHAAALLPDGRTLITGGLSADLALLSSSEVFDPETGQWSALASMASARRGHDALPLRDGVLLIVGGVGQTLGGLGILADIPAVGALVATEIYDAEADAFRPAADMLEGHSGGLAVPLPDGRALVAGGYNESESLASAEVYDPRANAWTRTRRIVRRTFANAAAALPDGRILFTGGFGMSREHGGLPRNSEVFDPVTNEWSATAETLVGRMAHAAAALPDGSVLAIGGSTARGAVNTGESLDPRTGIWRAIAPMSEARSEHTATPLPDGRLLVVGGGADIAAEIYDPDADAWTIAGR